MDANQTVSSLKIRAKLLEKIGVENSCDPASTAMQAGSVLGYVAQELGYRRDIRCERLVLSEWNELFRTGFLAWGHNIDNAEPPFFHVTERGVRALEHAQRDPSNPDGYIAHLNGVVNLGDIAMAYVREALNCYVTGSHKAAAVMLGAASERLVLDLRDVVLTTGFDSADGLTDFRIKKVQDAIKTALDKRKRDMPRELQDSYESTWPAFTQSIRAARNEAGHPAAIDPHTAEMVHALFLMFPELAKLSNHLGFWVAELGKSHKS